MNELKETTLEMMDDIITELSGAVGIIITWVWFILVAVTTPIWVIPYLISKKRKENKDD
jgi:hypothetical protein